MQKCTTSNTSAMNINSIYYSGANSLIASCNGLAWMLFNSTGPAMVAVQNIPLLVAPIPLVNQTQTTTFINGINY